MSEIIEGIEDSTLINLNQLKAFDKVDHRFLLRFWRLPDSNRFSADGIAVFVSRHSDITAIQQVIAWYENVSRANINSDKREGLWLGA